MTYLQAILLGVIQGATEFIPVSSSGHLVLVPYYLGWQIPEKEAFVFDVLSQTATLLAVLIYFWSDLKGIGLAVLEGLAARKPFGTEEARMGWLIALSSVPAGLTGLFFKESFESTFSNPLAVALFLSGTAGILFLAEQAGHRTRQLKELRWQDAAWIGLFQIAALYPGISRSGATIAGGMTRHFERTAAARFSFLMAVPIMLGAGLSATVDLARLPGWAASLPPMLVGFVVAAGVGYLAIHWLLAFLARSQLNAFALYCLAVSFTSVLWFAT